MLEKKPQGIIKFFFAMNCNLSVQFAEAATQRCSWKKMLWKCAANLQENTHAEVWFQSLNGCFWIWIGQLSQWYWKFSLAIELINAWWSLFSCLAGKEAARNHKVFLCHELQFIGAICRSSHPEVFLEKDVVKIRSKITGEHPCRSVIWISEWLLLNLNLSIFAVILKVLACYWTHKCMIKFIFLSCWKRSRE